MARKIFIAAVAVAAVFAVTYFVALRERPVSAPAEELKKITVGNAVYSAEIVNTPELQEQGLSDRASLGEGRGMFFVFPDQGEKTFWMKDMRFPLDFIWILKGVVVGVTENAPPDDGVLLYGSPGAVDMVLEINAGEVERRGIKKGDRVTIERNESR